MFEIFSRHKQTKKDKFNAKHDQAILGVIFYTKSNIIVGDLVGIKVGIGSGIQ